MRNLLNPKWLLVVNTLPILLLFLIFIGDFNIIKTLLDEYTTNLWQNFGLALFVISMCHLFYTLFTIFRKKEISTVYGFTALIIYSTYLYTYLYHSDDFLPRTIPRWLLSGELTLYVGTFIMPTLAHALFVIVVKLTAKNRDYKAWKSFLITISIPLLSFIFAQVILPMAHIFESNFSEHIIIIFMVIGVLLFLFFLIRTIYIVSLKKSSLFTKYELVWKIPIALIFPILGLFVNQGFLIGGFTGNDSGVFGDFGNVWFFGIAMINGILICLPNTENKKLRLLLFVARSTTFIYTLYFFLVFLPYLPLSIIAIVAIGTGFLMLTPLVLFIIHIQQLAADYNYLKLFFSRGVLTIAAIAALSIIPFFIIVSFVNDRNTLHETLDYVYNPDYSKDYEIDKASLKITLEKVLSNKKRGRNAILGKQTPYLSPFFNWLVLDNLTLSDKNINTIETIFFNKQSFGIKNTSGENIRNQNVSISNITSTSTFNAIDNSWTSWIDLEITNANSDRFSEYATTINLPNGCWINDYYLYIGDRKEKGILAEKKSALWVFSQIRNENRDPGLLYYLTGNEVAFRVFPFLAEEVRKTGIQFIHKEPVTITIDNHEIALGTPEKQPVLKNTESTHVVYISEVEKLKLEKIERTPYLHFILDVSEGNSKNIALYKNNIDAFSKRMGISVKNAKISFVNSFSKTLNYNDNWKSQLDTQTIEGGFYLERGIKTILYESYLKSDQSYPIMIVLSDSLDKAILPESFKDLEITYPDTNIFYALSTGGDLTSHDLNNNPKKIVSINKKIKTDHSVRVWPDTNSPRAYLKDTATSSLVLKSSFFDIKENKTNMSLWQSGLELHGKYIAGKLFPAQFENDWNNMVRLSFQSKIMTPFTAYIVVENEAQKALLKKKQEQALAGKKSLDLGEDAQRMSEPGIFIILLLFGLYVLYRKTLKTKFYY